MDDRPVDGRIIVTQTAIHELEANPVGQRFGRGRSVEVEEIPMRGCPGSGDKSRVGRDDPG